MSPVPCPFPSLWPLRRALLAARLGAAPQPGAEQTPRSPAPSLSRVRAPRRSARGVCAVPSVLTRNKEIPVVCRNGKILTVVK